jgi:outer membrane protein
MKNAKKAVIGLVLSMFVLSLSAQTGAGKLLIGGSSSFGFNATTDKYKSDLGDGTIGKGMQVNLAPQVGFFVIDGLAVGLELNIDLSSFKVDDSDSKTNSTALIAAPFVRYYYGTNKIKPFAEGSIGFGTLIEKDKNGDITTTDKIGVFGFGFGIGAAMFLNDNVSVDLGIGYNSMTSKVKEDNPDNDKYITSVIGFQVGFSIVL